MGQALRKVRGALVLLPAVVLALPTGAAAQGSALGISMAKPFTDVGADAELLNSAWQISYAGPVGSYGLEVRLPLALGRYDGPDGEFAIGNPYVGLTMAGSGTMTYFGGVNLPLAPDDKGLAMLTGGLSDATDFSGYMPDFLTVSGGVSSMTANADGVSPFWGGAAQLGVYMGDNDAIDGTEIFIRGWGGVNYPMESFSLNGGVKADFWLTQGDVGGDASDFGIFGGGSMAAGPGTAGASLTLPLSGDWSDATSMVLGLQYSLPLD